MSLPPLLNELGIPEDCVNQTASAQEKGRSFVINRQQDEVVWRIMVDHCWLRDSERPRVDYLFLGINHRECLVLVELKGKNFGHALEQIASALAHLYELKPALRQVAAQGGLSAYVVMSKGQGVSRRFNEIAKIAKKYHVIVHPKSQRHEINGVSRLC